MLKNTVLNLMLLGLIFVPIDKALSQTLSQTQNKETQSQKQPKSTWETILELLKGRKEPSLGSRGLICPLSPGSVGTTTLVWNSSPLFLWRGRISQIYLHLYSSTSPEQDQKLLWSQKITFPDPEEKLSSLIYTGTALQPDQSYDWVLIDPNSQTVFWSTFRLMASPEREKIESDLNALEIKLKTAGFKAEAISLERSKYFAQKDLWSDALQEIYSIKNPSFEVVKNRQEIITYLCSITQTLSN